MQQHILLKTIFPSLCRWFGNTRVIGQTELARFRDELGSKVADPYTVILKGKKLPMSLLNDPKGSKPNMLQVRFECHRHMPLSRQCSDRNACIDCDLCAFF